MQGVEVTSNKTHHQMQSLYSTHKRMGWERSLECGKRSSVMWISERARAAQNEDASMWERNGQGQGLASGMLGRQNLNPWEVRIQGKQDLPSVLWMVCITNLKLFLFLYPCIQLRELRLKTYVVTIIYFHY